MISMKFCVFVFVFLLQYHSAYEIHVVVTFIYRRSRYELFYASHLNIYL